MNYVVKKDNKYVHSFRHEGVPCRAKVDDWTDKQTLAFRWDDRNGASGVAFDIQGRVVPLFRKSEKKCPRCGNDGNTCSMCGAGGQPKISCDPVTGDELDTDPETPTTSPASSADSAAPDGPA